MLTAVLLSTALALLAAAKKALTPGGCILAWMFCIVITYWGGICAFAVMVETIAFVVLADKLSGGQADPHEVRRKSGARDCVRVLCNVGFGTAAILLFGLMGKSKYCLVFYCVMASSLADSLASKIGPLSKSEPVDICTFRKVKTGISGGVTLLGLVASLSGGIIIGVTYTAFNPDEYVTGLVIATAGLCGSLIDSILGSAVQVKFICQKCGTITEREEHCGVPTQKCKGIKPINNDAVNFFSNAAIFVIALLINKF